MGSSFEKRSYIRYQIQGKIILTLNTTVDPANPGSRAIEGELVDVSFSGICAIFKEKIEKDAVVGFDFTPESYWLQITGTGKVMNACETKRYGLTEYRIGVEFVEVDRDLVKDLVNQIQTRICDETRRRWQNRPPNTGPL